MEFNQEKVSGKVTVPTIIKKFWEDESIRQELVNDPVRAIEKFSGKPLNMKGKKLVIVDQTDPSKIYINIPIDRENMELTEVELEVVAGGVAAGGCNPRTLTIF